MDIYEVFLKDSFYKKTKYYYNNSADSLNCNYVVTTDYTPDISLKRSIGVLQEITKKTKVRFYLKHKRIII